MEETTSSPPKPSYGPLRRAIIDWGRKSSRPMPWRSERNAYRVWLSEIMLQQTTVAAVVPYYERFLARFPTVDALAEADEQAVLSLWEGLGYYSRARNLHRAARMVAQAFQGRFPESVSELQKLPGVGRYTAGAIASFAYGHPAPIVEANTLRLYSRILGYEGDPRSTAGQKQLWSFAEALLPSSNVGAFNQALIDLGATICTPAGPTCDACPLHRHCRAFQEGRQHSIPRLPPRPEVTQLYEVAFAVRSGDRWLLRQRSADERWGGLWDFPRLTIEPQTWTAASTAADSRRLLANWNREAGLEAADPVSLPDSTYGFTRYRVQLRRIVAAVTTAPAALPDGTRFVSQSELRELPLTRSSRMFAEALEKFRHVWQNGDAPFQLQATARSRRGSDRKTTRQS